MIPPQSAPEEKLNQLSDAHDKGLAAQTAFNAACAKRKEAPRGRRCAVEGQLSLIGGTDA